MAKNFFEKKRHWSKYKDAILEYYLEPYIAKVKKLRKPVVIIDCCAGPGAFDDGNRGSPLIIADAVSRWRQREVDASGLFVESVPNLYASLVKALEPYGSLAECRHGQFEDSLPEIASLAARNTVFLYVDPYTVRDLRFDTMKGVFDQIKRAGASVEILLNFNTVIFMRWALAALKRYPDISLHDEGIRDDETFDDPAEPVEIETLSAIAGGDYWVAIAEDSSRTFPEKVADLGAEYQERLSESFAFVCSYAVKEKYRHKVPKYVLYFGTRREDGLLLMNDSMCKARREFVHQEFSKDMLFDKSPTNEVVDTIALQKEILAIAAGRDTFTRPQIRIACVQRNFCKYAIKDIDGAVRTLLKHGKIVSQSGKSRINDSEQLMISKD